MKKFVKILSATGMLVGLAACGGKSNPPAPAKTWDKLVKEFLASNGYEDAVLPSFKDFKSLDGVKISYEVREDEGGEYAAISFETETPSEIGMDLIYAVVLTDGYVELSEDFDYEAYGFYSLTCMNDFNESGKYVTVEVDVMEEESLLLDEEEKPYAEVYFWVEDGNSAADIEEAFEDICELGEYASPIAEEGSLELVSPYFVAEPKLSDKSQDIAEAICAKQGGEADGYYSLEKDGYTSYEMEIREDEEYGDAAKRVWEALKEFAPVVDEELAYDEEELEWYGECSSTDGSVSFAVDAYPGWFGDYCDLYAFPNNEEVIYLKSISVSAPDFDDEMCEALTGVVNEEDYDLDSSIAEYWYYDLTSKKSKNSIGMEATFYNRYDQFNLSLGEDTIRSEWPAEKIAEFMKGYTAKCPSAEGLFFAEDTQLTSGDKAFVVYAYENVEPGDPECLAEQLNAAFEAASDWELIAVEEDDGATYYIYRTVEVVEEHYMQVQFASYNAGNSSTVLPVFEMLMYERPDTKEWFASEVAAYVEACEYTDTVVPSYEGKHFFYDDSDGYPVMYSRDGEVSAETYAAQFDTSKWDVVAEEVKVSGYDTTVYTAKSHDAHEASFGMKTGICVEFFEIEELGYFQVVISEDYVDYNYSKLSGETMDAINAQLETVGLQSFDFSSIKEIEGFNLISEGEDEYDGYYWQFICSGEAAQGMVNMLVQAGCTYYSYYGVCANDDFTIYATVEQYSGFYVIVLMIDPAE